MKISATSNKYGKFEFLNIKTGTKGMFTIAEALSFGWTWI